LGFLSPLSLCLSPSLPVPLPTAPFSESH
jgi:hypothetical protein